MGMPVVKFGLMTQIQLPRPWGATAELDAYHATSRPTKIEPVLSWPHYQLSPTKQPAAALIHANDSPKLIRAIATATRAALRQ